jgi:hypothetical protein
MGTSCPESQVSGFSFRVSGFKLSDNLRLETRNLRLALRGRFTSSPHAVTVIVTVARLEVAVPSLAR